MERSRSKQPARGAAKSSGAVSDIIGILKEHQEDMRRDMKDTIKEEAKERTDELNELKTLRTELSSAVTRVAKLEEVTQEVETEQAILKTKQE